MWPEALPEFFARVRRHTALPLTVGFGITGREHVVAVGKLADAVAVGSAVVAVLDAGRRARRQPMRVRSWSG